MSDHEQLSFRFVPDGPESAYEVDMEDIERRRNARRRASGQVTVLMCSPDDIKQSSQRRIGSVRLHDVSFAGIGATVDEHIELGTRITLFLPGNDYEPCREAVGKIVRCYENTEGNGYKIGVELDRQILAA